MAETPLIGTFQLVIYDDVGNDFAVVWLRSATLSRTREALPAANPDEYGPDYFIPGTSAWSGSASFLEVTASDGVTEAEALDELDDAYEDGRVMAVLFTPPVGATRAGECIITAFELGGAYDGVYEGAVELTGVGRLIKGLPAAPTGVEGSSSGGAITLTWD